MKVISLGNELRGDDSIGPAITAQLKQLDLPVPLDLIDAGSDAFTILDHLISNEPIIIIDCAKMNEVPGRVKKIKIDEASFEQADNAISLHGFSFAEVYKMSKNIGPVAECTLIGIEPKSLEFGSELSDEVKRSIPLVVKMVIEEAKKYGG